jgi:hypothetical protein
MLSNTRPVTKGWATTPEPGDVMACLEELEIQVARVIHGEAWALCPSRDHANIHPTKWSVNLETGQHSCFSCGFKGSFVYLVQEVLDYDRIDAEHWVRSRGGIERLRRVLGTSTHGFEPEPGVRPWNESRLALFTDPPGEALARRRISAGSVAHYGVRWNSEEDFWILPIRDPETGELWGFQEKSEHGWFSNKPGRVKKGDTLFGLDCFQGTTAIVVESPLDCLRIYTAGLSGAVSSYGVQITDRQLDLLFDTAEIVIFALDNDEAGQRKMWELRYRYLRSGKRIKFIDYSHIPTAKDLGTEGVSDKDIQQAFLNAKSILQYRLT